MRKFDGRGGGKGVYLYEILGKGAEVRRTEGEERQKKWSRKNKRDKEGLQRKEPFKESIQKEFGQGTKKKDKDSAGEGREGGEGFESRRGRRRSTVVGKGKVWATTRKTKKMGTMA